MATLLDSVSWDLRWQAKVICPAQVITWFLPWRTSTLLCEEAEASSTCKMQNGLQETTLASSHHATKVEWPWSHVHNKIEAPVPSRQSKHSSHSKGLRKPVDSKLGHRGLSLESSGNVVKHLQGPVFSQVRLQETTSLDFMTSTSHSNTLRQVQFNTKPWLLLWVHLKTKNTEEVSVCSMNYWPHVQWTSLLTAHALGG